MNRNKEFTSASVSRSLNRTNRSVSAPSIAPKSSVPSFNHLELELNYSDYLAGIAEKILAKKELKERESNAVKRITSVHERTKKLKETCHLLQSRIIELEHLSASSDAIDLEMEKLEFLKEILEKYEISKVLENLGNMIKKFDVLRCQNIILPKDTEEAQRLETMMFNCLGVLEQLMNDQVCWGELEELRKDYENYAILYEELWKLRTILNEKIGELQIKSLISMALS